MPQPAQPNKTNSTIPVRPGARASWAPAGALAGVFLVGAAVLWGMNWTRGRAACDQYDYHLKAILKFAEELPRPDLHDYASATTPGYHLLLAAVARCITREPLVLQIVASVFTLGLLPVFGRTLARAGATRGQQTLSLTALALPVVCSPYVFTPGVWLLPDNAGWLLALGVLLPVVRRPVTGRSLAICSIMLALTVLVRQNHLWLAGPLIAAAWLSRTPPADESLAGALRRPGCRIGPSLGALAACLPAIAIVAAFALVWHGLVPPSFQVQHTVKGGVGINWATPPFILSLVAIYSVFFIGWVWPGVVRLWRESAPMLMLVALGALVWSILPETTFKYEPRASGLWNVVGWLDRHGIVYLWDDQPRTSPLIVLLSPIGAVMLAGWLALIDDRRRWIVGAAIAAFIAAQAANANCWQRYHEPFLLMLMALIAARYAPALPERAGKRWPSLLPAARILGPLLLAALLAAVTIGGLLTGRDALAKPERPAPARWSDPSR